MELLIPGLLLVALMVWASTRIKRTAADAFDAETVETNEFTIAKSAGWLSIAVPKLPFEAYTKEYAPVPHEDMRLGTATVEASSKSVDDVIADLTAGAQVTEQVREKVGDHHYRILTLKRSEGDVDYLELVKIGDAGGTVYTFRIRTLPETTPDFHRDIEGMLDSFQLKNV